MPCSRVSPQLWTLPARAGIQTHNLGLSRVLSPTLYPLGHDCPQTELDNAITKFNNEMHSAENVMLNPTLLTQFAYFDTVQCFVTICIVKSTI